MVVDGFYVDATFKIKANSFEEAKEKLKQWLYANRDKWKEDGLTHFNLDK